MSNVFEKAVLEATEESLYWRLVGLAKSAGNGLFESYQMDLYVHDRDTLLNDAQAGDIWVWVLKECGTWLTRLKGYPNELLEAIRTGGRNQRLFRLDIVDEDRGVITEITMDQALELDRNTPANPKRVPRRKLVMEQIRELFPDFMSTRLSCDIDLEDNSTGWITFTRPVRYGQNVCVELLNGSDLSKPQLVYSPHHRLDYHKLFPMNEPDKLVATYQYDLTTFGYGTLVAITEDQKKKAIDLLLKKSA